MITRVNSKFLAPTGSSLKCRPKPETPKLYNGGLDPGFPLLRWCASTSLQHCCYFQHCAPVPTYHGFNTCCFWALDISSVEPSYCCPWWPMNLHQRHGALQPRVSSVGSVTSVLPCPASHCPGWCNPWAGRHTSPCSPWQRVRELCWCCPCATYAVGSKKWRWDKFEQI